MSPKSSKFHKKLLKTEYRKILRVFVADIMEFPQKVYLEKLQTNFQDGSNLPEFAGKNKDHTVSWDLEMVTT